MKIAVTGHRPNKLGGFDAQEAHRAIRRHMRDLLQKHDNPELISGGALGIDQMWIQVGLYLDLKITAVLPFKGYNEKWPLRSQIEYQELLDQCKEVRYIADEFSMAAYQKRNEWMVDNSDLLVAYWNGSNGGTANCVQYARNTNRNILIFNTDALLKI